MEILDRPMIDYKLVKTGLFLQNWKPHRTLQNESISISHKWPAHSHVSRVVSLMPNIVCERHDGDPYLWNLQLMLEKDLKSMSRILFRYCPSMSTHRTSVSITASTVSINAIVFDLIDFRVIVIPDRTLPTVPNTGKEMGVLFVHQS